MGEPRVTGLLPVAEAVRRAVTCVSSLLTEGHGVSVRCRMGIGRSSLVIGAALVSDGHAPASVTAWLDEVPRAGGVPGWPESPWQAGLLESSGRN